MMSQENALLAARQLAFSYGHRPVFEGNERQYLVDCIDSNFVSSVGAKVTEFEQRIAALGKD